MAGSTINLPLVQALTLLSFANSEAADQTKSSKVASILLATAKAADEAARAVAEGLPFTPAQQKLIEELTP